MRLFGIAVLLVGVTSDVSISYNTEIEIPKDKQESHEGKKQFYRIIVTPHSSDFKCQDYITAKRFKEFAKLYDDLKQNSPGHKLFEDDQFPRKQMLGLWQDLPPEEVEQRRTQLEAWLKKALEMLEPSEEEQNKPQFLNNQQSLQFFLDPDSGARQCTSGIMIPADQFKYCGKTHFFGIHVQSNCEGKGYYVFRRFNQFHDLAMELGERSWKLPGGVNFPWATFYHFADWNSNDVRRKNLESWMQGLMTSELWKPLLMKKNGFLDPRRARRDFYTCVASLAGIDVTDLEFDETDWSCSPAKKDSREEL